MKNNQIKPLFLYSQKLFQGEVNSIFLHPHSVQTTFFHSKTTLSLFELDENQNSKFNEIKATNFHEKIDFLTQISDQQILLSAGSKVYLTNNAQLKATIKLSNKISFLTKFQNNQILTTMKNSPSSVSIRSINRSLDICSKIDLFGNIPTVIETWKNQPFFIFGTNKNFVFTVDTRIGFPVYNIHIENSNCFNKIITFPCSNNYQFGVVSDDSIDFYDPRAVLYSKNNSPYFTIKGKSDVVENYCNGVMLLGSNGTFYINPNGCNGDKSVVSLFDNSNILHLKKSNDDQLNFQLPSINRKSLHNHLFKVSSMDYNKTSGLCCSGDNCGFVHMWLPPHLKYLNDDVF